MNKRLRTIEHIAQALALYDASAPVDEIKRAVSALDPESIGVLHGISGVLRHAQSAKMPSKWVRQIHSDLLEAFDCLRRCCADQN